MKAFTLPPLATSTIDRTAADKASIAAALCERAEARNKARLASLAIAKQNWEKEIAQIRASTQNIEQQDQLFKEMKPPAPPVPSVCSEEVKQAYMMRMQSHASYLQDRIIVPVDDVIRKMTTEKKNQGYLQEDEGKLIEEFTKRSKSEVMAMATNQIATATAFTPAFVKEDSKDSGVINPTDTAMEMKKQKLGNETEEEEETVPRPNLIEFLRKVFSRLVNQKRPLSDTANNSGPADLVQPQAFERNPVIAGLQALAMISSLKDRQ